METNSTTSPITFAISSSHHWGRKFDLNLTVDLQSDRCLSYELKRKSNTHKDYDDIISKQIDHLESFFAFLGAQPQCLKINHPYFTSSQGDTLSQVYRWIYNLPLIEPEKWDFVRLNTCGCNMGHCPMLHPQHETLCCRYGN